MQPRWHFPSCLSREQCPIHRGHYSCCEQGCDSITATHIRQTLFLTSMAGMAGGQRHVFDGRENHFSIMMLMITGTYGAFIASMVTRTTRKKLSAELHYHYMAESGGLLRRVSYAWCLWAAKGLNPELNVPLALLSRLILDFDRINTSDATSSPYCAAN
jgi:hypothetical protein